MSEKPNGKQLDAASVALGASELLKLLKDRGWTPQEIITVCQTAASAMTNVLSMETLMVTMAGMFGGKR